MKMLACLTIRSFSSRAASNDRDIKFGTRPKLKLLPFLVALLCGLCAFAAADDPNASSAALTANPIYQKDCAKCHGKTAEGRHFGGPSLISGKTAAASADDLRGTIANGKGRMPKFGGKLEARDIDALVEQIKAATAK
jgi:mono/diheme cytochrome c family protein